MKRSQKWKLIALTIAAIILLILSVFSTQLCPQDPYHTDLTRVFTPPSGQHLLGTDNLGRDIFSRILCGLGPSLLSALAVIGIVFLIGTVFGTAAGYFGGILDRFVMWLITTFQAFPSFLLAVVIAGFLGSGLKNACIALILVYWTTFARLARSLTLSTREQEFIQAATLGGNGHAGVLIRHILPNIFAPLFVTATAEVGSVIVSMAGLSFLGLSSQRPTAEWGVMLSEAQELIRTNPVLIAYISAAIVIVVLIFNLLGDVLRDCLDRRLSSLS